jgi:hypothetical protein
MELILRTKNSSFPFKGDIKTCGFEVPIFDIVSENFKVSEIFNRFGMSKSYFRRKLKEGAVRKDGKRIFKDEPIECGITEYRLGHIIHNVWFVNEWKRTIREYLHYFLGPLYVMVNKVTRKLFKKTWL